ncbi:MAG: M14 family zinc carboxypeptidase [Mycobacterium leprae]
MSITSLTQLYTSGGLLCDGDGDGLPDGFFTRFSVGRTPGAIDVAARLGLESAAWTPGFTRPDAPGVRLFFGPENPECPPLAIPDGCGIVALRPEGVVVSGDTPESGWDAARWLASTYPFAAPGGPLLGELAGGRSVEAVMIREGKVVDLKVGQPAPPVDDKLTVLEAPEEPAFRGDPPGDLPPAGPAQLFTVAGLMGSSDAVRHDRVGWQVAVTPAVTPAEIAALCELAARSGVEATGLCFPVTVEAEPGGAAVVLADSAPASAEWQEGALSFSAGKLIVSGTPAERAAALLRAAEAGLIDGLHAMLFTRRAGLPMTMVERGEPVFRHTVGAEWEVDRFRRLWQESVLPALAIGTPARVDLRLSEPLSVRRGLAAELREQLAAAGVMAEEVRVRSAYKQGFHWLEEEMLPQLQAVGPLGRVHVRCAPFVSQGEGEPLDMPIRWLQELYPADELLAAALSGVEVAFDLAEGETEAIYRLTASRPDGSLALAATFNPVYASGLYLPEFPERGTVHPPTGLLRVEQSGKVLCHEVIATDAQALWSAYQQQVLPALRDYLTQNYGDAPNPGAQPFFGALVIEASLSEENRRLGIREEQVSPLDAMHEDLYFYTLDYLNQLGLHLTGKGYNAPGAVEPWVTVSEGAPSLRVRLYARGTGGAETAGLPVNAADLPAAAGQLPLDQLIGPEELPPLLAYLAQLEGVRVWRSGLSYAGRATYSISVTAPTAGRIAPPQKLSAWRPTFLVNARHHANEVSSTNSILRFAEMAVQQGMSRHVNLVLNPMENVDGAAIHFAMQQVHPTWKLHAARFNAAGIEFAADYFLANPRFGEARPLPTLWRAFLPDVMLDDHGYPSHEWVQPFSGYNSPPYFRTSWWMPNAMIYGIHKWLDAQQYPHNARVQEGIRDALAERLTADDATESYTQVLLERYRLYGQRYLPEKFPLQVHRGFISQTGSVTPGPEARSFVGRFPHITAAELVTEVPDETAQGEYLARCVHAHLEGDLAILNFLLAHPQPVLRRRWEQDGRVLWTVGRRRPLRV